MTRATTITVAETWEAFSGACRYKSVPLNECSHKHMINPVCLDKKYCPRVKTTAKRLEDRPIWWTDFNEYLRIHDEQFALLRDSTAWHEELHKEYPDVDIVATLDKASAFWRMSPEEALRAGRKKCGWDYRKGKCKTLDWQSTYKFSIGQEFNQVKRSSVASKWSQV